MHGTSWHRSDMHGPTTDLSPKSDLGISQSLHSAPESKPGARHLDCSDRMEDLSRNDCPSAMFLGTYLGLA